MYILLKIKLLHVVFNDFVYFTVFFHVENVVLILIVCSSAVILS